VRRLAAVAVAAIVVLACHREVVRREHSPVILISVDTLRSDHLPAYGYGGVATPHIDALRKDAILFERAYSQVPLTLPSHATILTGMLPADHGVRDNIGFRLPPSVPTIAETLAKNGYATGGAVSAFVLRHETGIARGFAFFDDETESGSDAKALARMRRDGRVTVDALTRWIDTISSRPFFAFLHLYDPHAPYTPPEPYLSRYANHYDGGIAYADALVGDFIDHLKTRGVYDDALIIFLSDHGEGLDDHGEAEHGVFLYREALQVPLLVKLPHSQRAGESVKTPVALTDVFPTILDVIGQPHSGASLLAPHARPIYAESYYARFHFGWSDLHSLIDGNDHYIRAPQPELYDLASDPRESKNRVESDRRAFARLRDEIAPLVKDAAAPAQVDREEAAKLAALGYVGSTAAQTGVLADPKRMTGAMHDIKQAFDWYGEGNEAGALDLTNRLLRENPQITDLWDLKCKILNKLGRTAEVLETAREGLRHVPTSVALLYDVANAAFAVGRLDEAQQHAEIAAKMEPGEGHEILARIALQRNDATRAETEAKLAAESSGDPVNALMILASLASNRGDFQQALAYYDQASQRVAKRNPPMQQNLHLGRGDVLARLGRKDEAEREIRAEIHDFPKNAHAYSAMIFLLFAEHRLDEATKVVYDLVAADPEPHSYVVIAETLEAIGDDRGAHYWLSVGQRRYPADQQLRDLPKRLAVAH
jgi:predicted Zn-dependent protease